MEREMKVAKRRVETKQAQFWDRTRQSAQAARASAPRAAARQTVAATERVRAASRMHVV